MHVFQSILSNIYSDRNMRIPSIFIKRLFYMIIFSLALVKMISFGENTSTKQITKDLSTNMNTSTKQRKDFPEKVNFTVSTTKRTEIRKMKYILIWTNTNSIPCVSFVQGQQGFIDRKCPFTNCYVTAKRSFFAGDYTKFDAITFLAPEIFYTSPASLPLRRSSHQKFVFASMESSDNYPLCHFFLDGFFNWTWTYKLDSDARWGYVVVRDSDKKVIGPNTIMHWMDLQDMDPVSDELKLKLKSKSKAAAWIVSNCESRSKREKFIEELSTELNRYNLSVDVFGSCGKFQCTDIEKCLSNIQKYYFYLAFENSFSEDYVTEKLLHGLQYNAVPVVFGGANYTRFMPNGMYLNARNYGPKKLASKINELIKNPKQYYEYFRWKNHYSYHSRDDSLETNDYCRLCAMMNNEQLMGKTTVYEKFADWWNPVGRCYRA